MTTPNPATLRVGDAEREDAMRALGEHMASGRLDLDEYSERTVLVTAARTWADLTALFTDLPEPHPSFAAAEAAETEAKTKTTRSGRSGSSAPFPRAAARAEAMRARFPTMNLAGRIAFGAVIAIGVFSVGMVLLTVLPMILIGGLVMWLLFGAASHGRWGNQAHSQMRAARQQMYAARRRARAEYYGCRRSW